MISVDLTQYPLNTAQAAAHLDISLGYLYNLVSRHEGPRHVKYGNQLRFAQADLDAWVADRCVLVTPLL